MEETLDAQNKSVAKTERMGTENIGKLLWEFGLPATIGILVNALYNIVDSIFIGHGVGELGIAAATAAFPPMLLMMAFGMLIGGGGNALMAIKLGEKDYKTAEKILGNSLFLMIVVSIIVTVLGLTFIRPILAASGASAAVMPYGIDFMTIIFPGMIFQCIGFGMNNFIRTTGSPKRAMVTMLTGAIINIILDYILIMRLGWGVKGAGVATVTGQCVNSIIVLQYFLGKKSPLKLRLKNLVPSFSLSGSIIALGTASFAMQVAASVVNVVLNSSLARHGAQTSIGSSGALAAMGVVSKSAQFFVMPIIGMVMSAQPIIGYNYGAHKYDRVKKAFKLAAVASTVYLTAFWALLEIFPGPIISLFGLVKKDVVAVAQKALRIYLLMMPIIGFQMVGSNYFQATGQPAKSAILTLSRQVILLIPLILCAPLIAHAMGMSADKQLIAIVFAAPISDLISTCLTTTFVIRELRKLDRKHEAVEAGENPALA